MLWFASSVAVSYTHLDVYKRQPLASMDTRGRVIYMGTFSKSLSPALRMNYLVLPEPLLCLLYTSRCV